MSDFTASDRPGRVGELSLERAVLLICAARGTRRARGGRDGDSSVFSFWELVGETSGEKRGGVFSLGDVSWIGEIGLLPIFGGGVEEDK